MVHNAKNIYFFFKKNINEHNNVPNEKRKIHKVKNYV